MKIEMGESLFYSWLRHIKCCQIVQTNWKTSPKWSLKNECELKSILEDSNDYLKKNFQIDILGNNASISQFLQQAECDVIGISCEDGNTDYYAVEVAYHTNGLQYGNGKGTDGTAAKVAEKFVRSALCLYGYFNTRKADIVFASPKINNAVLEILNPVISKLQELFNESNFQFKFSLIYNELLVSEVIEPLKSVWNEVSDTSELFGRSMQLIDLFYNLTAKEKVCRTKRNTATAIPNINTLERTDSKCKIGELAQREIRILIEQGKVQQEELIKLQDKDYSKRTLGINYACLVEVANETKIDRYYKGVIKYGGHKYKLCREWYEQPNNNDRPLLEKWIANHKK